MMTWTVGSDPQLFVAFSSYKPYLLAIYRTHLLFTPRRYSRIWRWRIGCPWFLLAVWPSSLVRSSGWSSPYRGCEQKKKYIAMAYVLCEQDTYIDSFSTSTIRIALVSLRQDVKRSCHKDTMPHRRTLEISACERIRRRYLSSFRSSLCFPSLTWVPAPSVGWWHLCWSCAGRRAPPRCRHGNGRRPSADWRLPDCRRRPSSAAACPADPTRPADTVEDVEHGGGATITIPVDH